MALPKDKSSEPGKTRGPAMLESRGNALYSQTSKDGYPEDNDVNPYVGTPDASNDPNYFPTLDKEFRRAENSQAKARPANNENLDPEDYPPTAETQRRVTRRAPAETSQTSSSKKISLEENMFNRAIITGIMIGQIPWMIATFIFGLLGTIFLGAILAMDAVTTPDGKGFWGSLVAYATSAINELAQIVGIDFGEIAFSLFLVCFVIVLGIMLISVTLSTTIMMVRGIKPLSGQAEGLKWGSLLLVFIGYSIPIVNMFPWILVYLGVVWLYPK